MILLQHADQLSYEELMALDTAALVVHGNRARQCKLQIVLGTVEHQEVIGTDN